MNRLKPKQIADTAADNGRPVLRGLDGLDEAAAKPAVEVSQLRKTPTESRP